jgi:Ca-activated chloride channel homolog
MNQDRSRSGHRAVLILLCFAGFVWQSPADDHAGPITPREPLGHASTPTDDPRTFLRVDSSLVLIPVHVTTLEGASVTNLRKEDFQLFEGDEEQKISYFGMDDAPVSAGLVFDASGSMHDKIKKSSQAAAQFLNTSNLEDEFFLVQFNERPKLAVSFTSDSDAIYKRIVHTRAFGRTSLLDAIKLALVQMKHARNFRKAIIVLSDGGDNRSRFTPGQIRDAIFESDVQLYSMGIFNVDDERRTPEESRGPRLLADLAEQSGGRHFRVDNLNDLESISAQISRELRNQYVLGYSPADKTRDGKYRPVRLKLKTPPGMPRLRVYYRHGYYAPLD